MLAFACRWDELLQLAEQYNGERNKASLKTPCLHVAPCDVKCTLHAQF